MELFKSIVIEAVDLVENVETTEEDREEGQAAQCNGDGRHSASHLNVTGKIREGGMNRTLNCPEGEECCQKARQADLYRGCCYKDGLKKAGVQVLLSPCQ